MKKSVARIAVSLTAVISAALGVTLNASYADDISGVSVFSRSSLTPTLSHFSVGLGAETLGGNPGLGATLSSPFFMNDIVAVRASLIEFADHGRDFASATDGSLRPYTLVKLGLVFAYPAFHGRFRLSIAPGVAYTFQTQAYSTQSGLDTLKGYFTFEAEYLPRGLPDLGLFLNLGAMQPNYANKYSPVLEYAYGFDASVGLRHYF